LLHAKKKQKREGAIGHGYQAGPVIPALNAQILARVIKGKIKMKIKEDIPMFIIRNGKFWKRSSNGYLVEVKGIHSGDPGSS